MPQVQQKEPKKDKQGFYKDWRSSRAKAKLIKDIVNGVVPEDADWEDVYEDIFHEDRRRHELYANYNPVRFRANLKSIRSSLKKKKILSEKDSVIFDNTFDLHPRYQGEDRWDGSEAQMELRRMVKDGEILGLKPAQIFELHESFQVFDKSVFINALGMEKRRHTKYVDINTYTNRRRRNHRAVLQHDPQHNEEDFYNTPEVSSDVSEGDFIGDWLV